jgi:hypothetical protein
MANRNRSTGGYGTDHFDEYLRNEYRAEEGAYLERRPNYAQDGSTDRDPRFWEPSAPAEYYADEGFTGAGMAIPRDEPLRRDESGFEHGRHDASSGDFGRREPDRRYGSIDRSRSSRDPRQRDREAGRKLAGAAESFYENLAGAVGLGTGHDQERGHRGRGPRNYRRSDARILDEVNHRLTDDAYVDASDVEVIVSNQEVTLSGTVATRFEKRHAEDIAEAVSGVAHVQNNLRVRPAQGAFRSE